MQINLEIPDERIDGISLRRNSVAFDGGKWEVYLSHRFGSVRDQYGRILGPWVAGKGVDLDISKALSLALAAFEDAIEAKLAEQNASPPKAPPSLASGEAELFSLLGL